MVEENASFVSCYYSECFFSIFSPSISCIPSVKPTGLTGNSDNASSSVCEFSACVVSSALRYVCCYDDGTDRMRIWKIEERKLILVDRGKRFYRTIIFICSFFFTIFKLVDSPLLWSCNLIPIYAVVMLEGDREKTPCRISARFRKYSRKEPIQRTPSVSLAYTPSSSRLFSAFFPLTLKEHKRQKRDSIRSNAQAMDAASIE